MQVSILEQAKTSISNDGHGYIVITQQNREIGGDVSVWITPENAHNVADALISLIDAAKTARIINDKEANEARQLAYIIECGKRHGNSKNGDQP